MPENDPRNFAPFVPFDPEEGTVIFEPPGEGPGYWVGAPGVTYDVRLGRFYMVYRLRKPLGVVPERGC